MESKSNNNKISITNQNNDLQPNSDKIFTNLEEEFNKLLIQIDSEKADENPKNNISNIDLDFLKNDYIELYDIKKLLDDPKYHIAKFKIRFLDFINLIDFFYKALDSDYFNEQNKINKSINKNNNENKSQTSESSVTNSENEKNKPNENSNESKKHIKQKKKNAKNEKSEDDIQKASNTNKKDSKEVLKINKDEKKDNNLNVENKNKDENKYQEDIKIKKNEKCNQYNDSNSSNKDSSTNKKDNDKNDKNMQENANQSSNQDSKIFFSELLNFPENNSSNFSKKEDSQISKKNSKISESSSTNELEKALTDIKTFTQEDKKNEFKFKYIKKELGLEEYEKMTGKAYEDFARKSFKIMLMIISKINIDKIIDYYLKNSANESLRIKTNIHDIIGAKLVDINMEIDILAEFKYTLIKKLKEYFKRNIFFDEEIYKSEDEKNFDDITLVVEVARNIIKQGKEKLNQAIRYIELISILNLYNNKVTQNIEPSPILNFCEKNKISVYSTKMFCIITDGDYPFLKYVFNKIIKNIFEKNIKDAKKIKEFINGQLKDKDIMKKIEEEDMKLMEENIYNNYLMFDMLKKNNIKFCVLYIGDISHNLDQQYLVHCAFINPNLIEKENLDKLVKSFGVKKSLAEIKKKNRDLKIKISSFNDEINLITENKFKEMKSKFDSSIDNMLKELNISKFSGISRELKFGITFKILCSDKKDFMILEKIRQFQKSKPCKYLTEYEIIEFKNSLSFYHDYINNLVSHTEQKKFVLYIMKIDKNDKDDMIMYKMFYDYKNKIKKNELLSNNVRYLVYNKNDNGIINIDYGMSDFQYILDKKIININKRIINEIYNLKKTIKYSTIMIDEKTILNKMNLTEKLKVEFYSLFFFNIDEHFANTIKIINNENYSINDDIYQKLFIHFKDAFELLDNTINMFTKFSNEKDDKILRNKLNELNENITCQRIYSYLYYKIIAFINKNIYSRAKNEILQFIQKMEITSIN